MAIVHVAMKSSSKAPPSAAHWDYIARAAKYGKKGDAVLVEPGNMPDFAQASPRLFWEAADVQERANGRTYTELQIALPRELSGEQRISLARQAAREFMGDSFAYTLAIHNPDADDEIEQPHLHLMFSERIVDGRTRQLPADQFFKRNGAKKDRKWNDQNKAEEIRAKWCEMMNRALEGAGVTERVDPRSLLDQGKFVEALLVEPKMLRRGTEEEKEARRQEIAEIRKAKSALAEMEIAGPDLESIREADRASQEKFEETIKEIQAWEQKQLSTLDRIIQALKQAIVGAAEALHLRERPKLPFPEPTERELQAAREFYMAKGRGDPLQDREFQQSPVKAWREGVANSDPRNVYTPAADKPEWKNHGTVIMHYWANRKYVQLKAKYPDQSEDALKGAAVHGGERMRNLGKSKQKEHGFSR